MINTGDFREALVYLNRAQVLRDQANLRRESAMGLMNLGILYRRMNLPDSSLTCYLKAGKVFTEMNDSNNLVKVRYNTGLILKNQGKYDQAREIMEQVLVICRKKGIIDGEVYTLHTLAAIFDEEGRIAEGLRYADSAIALAKERGLTRNLPHFLKRKEELLANAGNYSEAYATALEVTAISDSLLSLDKQKEISRLITRFETSRKEAENTLLKQDLRMQRARMIWLWFIFILGLLVFLLMVLIFRFRVKHLKQQQVLSEEKALRQAQTTRNNELELEKSRLESDLKETHIQKLEYQARLREQELVWQTLMRADLTNINRSVQEKLFPFGLRLSRKKDQEEFRRSLDELTRDAAREPLAEFEQTFRQLHPSFVENLLKGYPDLNKSEILISSLIRLNLSSKEIARLLNLSLATIETTRYHIRKKLSLNSSENLTAFLIQL